MKVLICGGRTLNEKHVCQHLIDNYSDWDITTVIEGEQRGGDIGARMFAIYNKIPLMPFPANWKQYGDAAGPIRNKEMLDKGQPDYVIAFPGGHGTKNMIQQTKKRGIFIEKVKFYEKP